MKVKILLVDDEEENCYGSCWRSFNNEDSARGWYRSLTDELTFVEDDVSVSREEAN